MSEYELSESEDASDGESSENHSVDSDDSIGKCVDTSVGVPLTFQPQFSNAGSKSRSVIGSSAFKASLAANDEMIAEMHPGGTALRQYQLDLWVGRFQDFRVYQMDAE